MNATKQEFINFRATNIEKQLLTTISAIENRKTSEMLRELIREGARKRGVDILEITRSKSPRVVVKE